MIDTDNEARALRLDTVRLYDTVRQGTVALGANLYSLALLAERVDTHPGDILDIVASMKRVVGNLDVACKAAESRDLNGHTLPDPLSYDNCPACGQPQNQWAKQPCSGAPV